MNNERIARSAYRYWQRAGMTEWPTVRQIARSLRLRQHDIEEMEGNGLFQLTGYNYEQYLLGDLYVVATTNDVEIAWCGYWLPYSAGCYCGQHQKAAK